MPSTSVGFPNAERIGVRGLLLSLATTVPTITGFELQDSDELPVPLKLLSG